MTAQTRFVGNWGFSTDNIMSRVCLITDFERNGIGSNRGACWPSMLLCNHGSGCVHEYGSPYRAQELVELFTSLQKIQAAGVLVVTDEGIVGVLSVALLLGQALAAEDCIPTLERQGCHVGNLCDSVLQHFHAL